MIAGILRKNLNVKWTKYRGTEPTRDEDDYPSFVRHEQGEYEQREQLP